MPHPGPCIRLLREVSGDLIGLPDQVVFRRSVESEVGPEVRVGDEGVETLGALDQDLRLSGFLSDGVVVNGLPNHRGGRDALGAQVAGNQADAKGAVDGEMESVGHRLGGALVEDAMG